MDLAYKQGQDDNGSIREKERLLLRLMMPVAKMYTAKKAVANASEGIECFGGQVLYCISATVEPRHDCIFLQGYIEDTGLPGFLRDAQVLPIWEGTSNVMALDVLRAMAKSKGEALKAFHHRIACILHKSSSSTDQSGKK